jgi:hypothetical protein
MVRRTQIVELFLAALMLVGVVPSQNRAVAAAAQVWIAAPVAPRLLSGTERIGFSRTGVQRLIGELQLCRQKLEREGRRTQVAAFLNRVRDARRSGVPEARVQAMVRAGLARGELRPNADAECRAIRQRLDELNHELAAGGSAEPVQVSVRR